MLNICKKWIFLREAPEAYVRPPPTGGYGGPFRRFWYYYIMM